MTTTMRLLKIAVLFVSLAFNAPGAAAAAFFPAPAHAHHPVALRVRWRPLSTPVAQLVANDRYTAMVTNPREGEYGVELIDRRTGTQTRLSPPACPTPRDPLLGGPWLALNCSFGTELYRLSTRQWRLVPQTGGVCALQSYGSPADVCGPAVAVGRYWLEFSFVSTGCAYCSGSNELENLATGAMKPDPTGVGSALVADPNAPSGTRTLCAPLSRALPAEPGEYRPEPASDVEFHGPFALASFGVPWGDDRNFIGPAYRLYRCASALDVAIGSNVAADDHAVLWYAGALRGLLLPSLKRFTIRLPSMPAIPVPAVAGLSGRTIYLNAGETVWSAQLPARLATST